MNDIVAYIILASTVVTAVSTIFGNIKGIGKSSKKGIDTYINNQVAPSLKEIKDSIESLHGEINTIKAESDEDKMQRLRYDCLCFASEVRKGEAKTRQEYEEIFRMESTYDNLIDKYNIKNGFMEEEMLFVHEHYRKMNNN